MAKAKSKKVESTVHAAQLVLGMSLDEAAP